MEHAQHLLSVGNGDQIPCLVEKDFANWQDAFGGLTQDRHTPRSGCSVKDWRTGRCQFAYVIREVVLGLLDNQGFHSITPFRWRRSQAAWNCTRVAMR